MFAFTTLDRVWYLWHEGRKTRILNRRLEQESIKASKELEQRNDLQIRGHNYFKRKSFITRFIAFGSELQSKLFY